MVLSLLGEIEVSDWCWSASDKTVKQSSLINVRITTYSDWKARRARLPREGTATQSSFEVCDSAAIARHQQHCHVCRVFDVCTYERCHAEPFCISIAIEVLGSNTVMFVLPT